MNIKHSGIAFALTAFILLTSGNPSLAEAAKTRKLHAMVIGNGAYEIGKLTNPANDAEKMSAALTDLGFTVTTKTDLDHPSMEQEISQFCRSIDDGGLAFFFFAGHGIQVNGENYLIPIDAKIPNESFVKYKAVSLSLILDSLGNSRSNMNVIVLDCCRNNPFERAWPAQERKLQLRGLAPQIQIPEGTIIAYATSPNTTATDGDGVNSPYTAELANAFMQRPAKGLLLREAFFQASRAVKQKTGQSPWLNIEASLDEFYLRPAEELVVAASVPSPDPEPALSLESISEINVVEPPSQPIRPEDQALLEQASVYLRQGQYEDAIVAYTAILESSTLPPLARQQARKSRGAAYLGRGTKADLNRAIIDQMAAGLKGIQLTVRASSADLRIGIDHRGSVSRGQVLLITRSMAHNEHDWFWVAAVNGDETLKGWVNASAVVKSDSDAPAALTSMAKSTARPESADLAIPVPNRISQPSQPIPQNHRPQASNVHRPSQHGGWQSGWNPNRNTRAKSIWATPQWETPAQIRRGIANGTLRW